MGRHSLPDNEPNADTRPVRAPYARPGNPTGHVCTGSPWCISSL